MLYTTNYDLKFRIQIGNKIYALTLTQGLHERGQSAPDVSPKTPS